VLRIREFEERRSRIIIKVETEKDTTACRQYHAAIWRINRKDCEEKYDQKATGA
jgi:hypothetical protein